MAHTNTINSTRLETLTKDNYDTWVIQVEALLVKNDNWCYVSGERPCPKSRDDDPTTLTAVKAWEDGDRKAKSDLILAISPSELKQVRGCKTSKEVWDKLKSTYDSKGPARKATLLKRLIQTKMLEGGNVREHIAQFFDAVDKLESMDVQINGDLLSIMLLYSLPSSFENFRCAIESRDMLPNAEQLKIKIVEEHDARNQSPGNETGALIARHDKSNPNARSNKNGSRNETKVTPRSKYKCSFCKISGHKYADCRKRKKQAADKTKDGETETFFAESAKYTSVDTSLHTNTSMWCLDSGCTSHLCRDIRMLSSPVPTQGDIKLANSTTSSMNAMGDIEFFTNADQRSKRIRLKNALHVPDLRTNLLSVAKIVDNGYRVIFEAERALVKNHKGEVVLSARRQGDLFTLNGSVQQANAATQGKRSDVEIWHERFGHLNVKDLLHMSKIGAASGLKINDSLDMSNCKICITQKLTSSPFSSRAHKSPQPLEIVHSDLCGPMRTNSTGGARYFLTFIDDYSRWCHVYSLKSKDEVANKFLEFKNLVENQTGHRIKALHSDNGKEFCNSTMDKILKDSGIQRRLTVPYTPQQNGVAERKNRTLVETARCLLAQSNLPAHFWGEALNTANYLRNRCISKSLNGDTPYKLWKGKIPDASHLRSFGSKVLVLNKNPTKGKFKPRAIEGIFLGYTDTSKSYRIWIPEDRKIIISRDVRFLNEYDTSQDSDEFTCKSNLNIRKDLGDEKINTTEGKSTEIASNRNEIDDGMPEPANTDNSEDNKDQEQDIVDAPPTGDNDDLDGESDTPARGPGRPRKILTGKPGRPAKMYHLKGTNQRPNQDVVTEQNHAVTEQNQLSTEDGSSDEAEWYDARLAMIASEVPFSEVVSGPNCDEWQDAVYDEIKSLVRNDTWTLVNRPTGGKVIGCRTVLRNKYKANGDIERRKARVVAKGFSQRPGVDFHDTFAPVARLSSLRTLVAISTEKDMHISQIDVTTAYLNGAVDTVIHMEKPKMLQQMLERIVTTESDKELTNKAKRMLSDLKEGDKVCLLHKALYGLRQSGRQWNKELDSTLKVLGLSPINADPCIYHDKDNHILLLVYVDDILIASRDFARIKELKENLAKYFAIKDLGDVKYCLGIEVSRNREGTYLSQSGYIRDVLARFGMSDCKPVRTPLDPNVKLHDPDGSNKENPDVPYRELIGSLMYLAQGTRPDIAFAVSALSQWCTSYNQIHWTCAKRVLRYLKETINHGLFYKKTGGSLVGFTDADWGNCGKDRRSYSGLVFLLANAAISWRSCKQRTVALSSTEAEYTALSDAAREAIYLSSFLKEIGFSSLSNVTVHNDNQGAAKLAANSAFHPRSKHIDIKHHFIREVLAENRLALTYTPTEYMVADALTKALPNEKHSFCTRGMGIKNIGTSSSRI